jgi:molybdopterin-guanine dinucleotide biosynthesis protein A
MGGVDKGLVLFRCRPLVVYALEAVQPVASAVLISANRNPDEYAHFGVPVIADHNQHYDGPLAGLLSAMYAAQTDYVLTVPCDSPLLRSEVLARLYTQLEQAQAEVCAAHDGERLQPTVLMVKRSLAADLAAYLASGQRKMETWLQSRHLVLADCKDQAECFANANTLEELRGLE